MPNYYKKGVKIIPKNQKHGILSGFFCLCQSLAERKTPLSGDMYCFRRDASIIKSLTCRNINSQKRNRCNKPHIHILHFIK